MIHIMVMHHRALQGCTGHLLACKVQLQKPSSAGKPFQLLPAFRLPLSGYPRQGVLACKESVLSWNTYLIWKFCISELRAALFLGMVSLVGLK